MKRFLNIFVAGLFAIGASSPAWAYDSSTISTPARTATYSAEFSALVPAASATDFLVLTGSATMIVRIKEVQCDGVSTAAASRQIYGIVRSTADLTGTSTNATVVPMDSTDVAATAVLTGYTVNPGTLGTSVGTSAAAPATSTGNLSMTWTFGTKNDKEVVLRGVAQGFALNANAASFAAGTALDCAVEWTESQT